MRELRLLIGISFRQMLYTFAAGQGRKKNVTMAGAIGLMAFLALYISGLYSWLMGELLEEAGVLEFLIPMMTLLAVAVSLIFTFFAAGGIVFGGKDTDFILSMPVSAFCVMLSRMSALYLENLLFVGLWMIPAGAAGFVFAGRTDPSYFLRLVLSILFVPFLPSALACLGGYVVAWAGARMRHRALLSNLISIALFLALMAGSMQVNQIGILLLNHRKEAQRLFMTWLLPIGLLGRGMDGDWGALLCSLCLCVLPFLGITWLFSFRYQAILSGLKSRLVRTDFCLKAQKAQGPFAAMLKKEISRFFSTPSYLLNAGMGAVLLLAAGVWMAVAKELPTTLLEIAGHGTTDPLVLGCMALLLSMIYPSAVSVSLEGRTVWLLKEAPLKPSVLFGAKICLNLTLAWPCILLFTALASLTLGIAPFRAACMALACLSMTGFLAAAGLSVNLCFPRLDADNDTVVIKQSASAIIACLGSMLIAGAAAGLYVLIGRKTGLEVFCLAMTALFAGLWMLTWRWLMKEGALKFEAL